MLTNKLTESTEQTQSCVCHIGRTRRWAASPVE